MKHTREWWRHKFQVALESGAAFNMAVTLDTTYEEPVWICVDEVQVGDAVYVLDPVERRRILREYDRERKRLVRGI